MLNSLAIATINVDKVWDAEKIKDLTEEANHGKMCGVCVRKDSVKTQGFFTLSTISAISSSS